MSAQCERGEYSTALMLADSVLYYMKCSLSSLFGKKQLRRFWLQVTGAEVHLAGPVVRYALFYLLDVRNEAAVAFVGCKGFSETAAITMRLTRLFTNV